MCLSAANLPHSMITSDFFTFLHQWASQSHAAWQFALGAVVTLSTWLLISWRRANAIKASPEPNSGKVGFKRAMQTPGKWSPQNFKYPEVSAIDFSLLEKEPPPYRPFRWGPVYHVTMGLRSMAWQEWIQLDRDFPSFMDDRQKRVDEKVQDLVLTLPSARESALEIALELSSYLAKRYPEIYVCHPPRSEHSDGGRGICQIECKLRQRKWTIQPIDSTDATDDPMVVIGLIIQDDAYIMMEREDGMYYLSGGAGLTPGFWRLKDKLGMQLKDVHISSDVPYFKEKLQTGMERFFAKLPVDKPVERNNYFFQLDDTLPWNSKMLGPEKHFVHKLHAPDPAAIAAGEVQYDSPQPLVRAEDLRLRSERQTLRRMPRTGAILFTVRTYITPLEQLVREPKIPGRFAAAMRSWDPTVAEYKGKAMFSDVVLPYLDAAHQKQIAAGVVAPDDRSHEYPY